MHVPELCESILADGVTGRDGVIMTEWVLIDWTTPETVTLW